MKQVSATMKEKKVGNHFSDYNQQQKQLNEATEKRYAALSYFEREEIAQWLKKNLSTIPILSKTKKLGLTDILAGHIESNAALLLLRYAMQILNL